jgi:hypothetical protein
VDASGLFGRGAYLLKHYWPVVRQRYPAQPRINLGTTQILFLSRFIFIIKYIYKTFIANSQREKHWRTAGQESADTPPVPLSHSSVEGDMGVVLITLLSPGTTSKLLSSCHTTTSEKKSNCYSLRTSIFFDNCTKDTISTYICLHTKERPIKHE